MDEQNRNLILATVLSTAVIFAWFILFPPESTTPPPRTATSEAAPGEAPADGATIPDQALPLPGEVKLESTTPEELRSKALARSPRIAVDTPRLTGSIALKGARIDDLLLKDYRQTLDPDSGNVILFSPVGTDRAYYAISGWIPAGELSFADVPGPDTLWEIEKGDRLTLDSPVILRWDNGKGLVFRRTISVDENYLFTVKQSVENRSGRPVRLAPYGIVARHGKPRGRSYYILHEGAILEHDGKLEEIGYKKIPDLDFDPRERGNVEKIDVSANGWVGFTDKYWMATLVPDPGTAFKAVVKYLAGADIYQVEARQPVMTIADGSTATAGTNLFAGAKEWETIRHYEEQRGFERFIDAIDWGFFFFLTKPIFRVLHFINGLIGNMGWAIIGLTLLIKALLFPLAWKSYVSMARMKELQPEIEKLKERAGEDRQMLQQEMMKLYREKKVNPAAGCLPILLQIPIFFSLYKVIFVTIELRHAPWILWIRDLSAPDPTSWMNLFGLLPWDAPDPTGIFGIFSIGVLPILLGISMWLQQKLNPTPTDPVQQKIFGWMPWVFMFMLGNFPSGLVLYWITNNTLSFTQQYIIMRMQGVKPDVLGNILASFRRRSGEKSG